MRSALHRAAASIAGIGFAEDAADAARRNLALVTDAYEEGVLSILDLIDAQNAALVAEQESATAVYDYLIDLMDAPGRRTSGSVHRARGRAGPVLRGTDARLLPGRGLRTEHETVSTMNRPQREGNRGRRRLGVVPAALLAAAACAEPPPPEPVVRPIRYYVVATASGAERTRTFSGVARAGVESTLSFRVAGAVASLVVAVGDEVRAGARIAALDPVDYELQAREAEAALRQAQAGAGNAQADLRRTRNLYENDNASRTDLDAATAAAEAAAAQVESIAQRLDLARRQVDHTRLTAPVAGAIAAVLTEVNENVSPGQPVVILAAGTEPEVAFAVPEALIRRVREGMPAAVGFDAIPGERFDGVVTEVGVTTTSVGTTFPVTVRLDADTSEIRSGMVAVVDVVFEEEQASPRFVLPGHAVGEDREGRFVFVATPTEDGLGVVRRRGVTVGAFAAGGLEVAEGIDEGDLVVTAGVNRLRAGDAVRLAPAGAR